MQISHRGPEHNTCVLSRHRRARLRRHAPRPEFRDPFVEPSGLDFMVDLAGGACRTLQAVLEREGDRHGIK
jgi:hypothetical protein